MSNKKYEIKLDTSADGFDYDSLKGNSEPRGMFGGFRFPAKFVNTGVIQFKGSRLNGLLSEKGGDAVLKIVRSVAGHAVKVENTYGCEQKLKPGLVISGMTASVRRKDIKGDEMGVDVEAFILRSLNGQVSEIPLGEVAFRDADKDEVTTKYKAMTEVVAGPMDHLCVKVKGWANGKDRTMGHRVYTIEELIITAS